MKTIDEQLNECIPHWKALIEALIPDIDDDCRASGSEFDEDSEPGFDLTIGFTPESEERDYSWSYQTGDNSFTGGAYGHRHWGVVSLYRDSDAQSLAEEIADQLGESLA